MLNKYLYAKKMQRKKVKVEQNQEVGSVGWKTGEILKEIFSNF